MTPEKLREESYAIKARWNTTIGMSIQDLIGYTIKSDAAKEYWLKDEVGKWEAQLKEERERSKKLLEALGWYADSGNYLAATNYPDDGVNSDTMLATAYAQKRIEKKAITAITEYKNNNQ